ncbi:MAG: GGIII-like transmembrane region-containing protein, partial [Candidatus Heimdallarchaeota archaeon]
PYCLSTGTHGVSLINCTDPSAADPVISSYPLATGGKQITTSGDYTYVANTTSLIILRHFESQADTYVAGATIAQSLEIDTLTFGIIKSATISVDAFVPPDSQINYFLSNDGGLNWGGFIPGTPGAFVDKGMDLRFMVEITGSRRSSVHLYELNIVYETSIFSNTMIYIIAGAGGGLILVIVLIVIIASVRKRKKTPTR